MDLVSLSLEEPDLSLFQPPDGYETVTEEIRSARCPEEHKTPAQ
jgi:hypothetical protein